MKVHVSFLLVFGVVQCNHNESEGENEMKTKISCLVNAKGMHTFFLRKDGKEYYLFTQNYRRGVADFFRYSVSFDQAIDFSRAKKDCAILRTMEKIALYTKYIERYYGIVIYDKADNARPKYFENCVYA